VATTTLTLTMLAHAYPSVIKHQAKEQGERGSYGPDEELIPMTTPEVRRLFTHLVDGKLTGLIPSCPSRGGDDATRPETNNAARNPAYQIWGRSTNRANITANEHSEWRR
jgi:hypothetical protein